MANVIDRLFGLEWLKKRVDAAYKQAKLDADDELAKAKKENGTVSMISPMFGAQAGKFQYSSTRKKEVVEYHIADGLDFTAWCNANRPAINQYVFDHAEDFGKKWFEETGEVPDGISRVTYEEPAKQGPAKLYGYKPEVVEAVMGGKLLESMNQLLLGDGDA